MATEVDQLLENVGYTPPSVQSTEPMKPTQAPKVDTPKQPAFATEFVKEDRAAFPLGIAPQKKRHDFVEYLSADPKERAGIDQFISDVNKGAIESAVPLDKLPGGQDFYKTSTGWAANLYSPERLNQIKAMPKIGAVEAWGMLNKWELAPYLNGVAIAEDIKVFNIMKKLQTQPDSVSPEDKKYAYQFLDEMAQMEIRGMSFGGNMIYYGLRMPAYAVEFAGAVSGIGGLVSAGREATELTVKTGLKQTLKEVAKGTVKAGGKGLLATVTPVAKLGGVAFPNVAMLARPAKQYMSMKLNDSIAITDKGQVLYKESTEKPAITMLKAFGSTWVENSSEMAGAFMFKPVTGALARKLPKGFGVAFEKLVEKSTGLKYAKAVAKFGYDGVLEEIGEERVGDLLRTTLNLEGKGYSLDAFGNALFPDWDQLQLELGMITVYGGSSLALGKIAQKLSVGKSPEQVRQLMNDLSPVSEIEKEKMVQQLEKVETERDIEKYMAQIETFKQTVGTALGDQQISPEDLNANVAIWDAAISKIALKTNKARSEIFNEIVPQVRGAHPVTEGGLFQESKQLPDIYTKQINDLSTGKTISTGQEITVSYVRNKERAPKRGMRFGQDIEPSGRYMNLVKNLDIVPKELEKGTITFKSPLVIEWNGYGENGWKAKLSKQYGGLTGDSLSQAIANDGYDGIITYSKNQKGIATDEVVDLTHLKTKQADAPKVNTEEIIKKAESYFGTTKDFNEAGYLTLNGKLLDFSGKKFGGDAGERALDHRQINEITEDQNIGMDDFVGMGNIRLSPESGGMDIIKMPNESQLPVIKKYIENFDGEIIIDLSKDADTFNKYRHQNTDKQFSNEYPLGTKPTKILNDIKKFYQGEKPIQSKVSEFRQGKQGSFNPKLNIISLFKSADRSTFLHESAHAFLEYYLRNIPDELKAVYKWAKVDFKPLSELSDAEYIKLQESFASGFEMYLLEGRAPSEKLADAFERFKDWLTTIYETVTGIRESSGLNIEINDDIRNFFDEMLSVPADRVATIDDTMTNEAKDRDLVLYQDVRKKLEEIKKKKKELKKKYGKKADVELSALETELSSLETMLDAQQEGVVSDAEVEPLDQQLKAIQEKLKEEAKAGSTTNLQAEVIRTIRKLNIDNADKVRFLGKIQQAKTIESQKKVLFEIYDMEQKYWEKQQRNVLEDRIKKLLKQTRPKAQAGITRGKYEYEFNNLFEELREIAKLTKEEAKVQLSIMSEQQDNEGVDMTSELKLKRLIMSWKAYGKSEGSLELFEQAHSDLANAIAVAKESKSEKEFTEKLNLSEKKDKVVEAIKKMNFKGDRDDLSTKIMNFYRQGFADVYGLMNSIAGKEIADEYALDVKEKDKVSELDSIKEEMYLDIADVLDVKNKYEVEKIFDALNKKQYELYEIGREKPQELTKWELIDIYNSIKNSKTRESYDKYYGAEQIDALMANLSEADKELADYLQTRVQEMYSIVNAIHVKQFGIDLGHTENYWPRKSELSEKEPYQEYRQATQIGSYQKSRVEGNIPKPQNAYLVANKHIDNAIHQKNLFDPWYNARKVFDSRRVKVAIEDKYGKEINQKLREAIDDVSFNSNNQSLDTVSRVVMKVLSNWTGAKILLNASLVPKQFIGAFNYIENVPANYFAKYFIEGLLNPKKTAKYMFEKSTYVPARFKQGADDIAQNIMKQGGEIAKSRKLTDFLSFFIRTGDAGAVVFGGYANVRYLIDVKGMSEAEAIQEFEKQTIRTQQAGFKTTLAGYQKIPGMKFFTAFKNAQVQMMRRVVNSMIQYHNGEIDKAQLAKTMTLYLVVQPALFGAVSVAWRSIVMGKGGDDDEYTNEMLVNIFTNPLAPIPLFSDASQNFTKVMLSHIKGEPVPFWAKNMSTPLLTDFQKLSFNTADILGSLISGNEIDFEDALEIMTLGGEMATGLPIGGVIRQGKGILRVED